MSLTQEQADARSRGIGGSEAAAVCGLSPWRTPVQVWQEKRGIVKPPDLDDVEHIRWGDLLEEVIGKEWARRMGQTVHRVRETKVHAEHPFMLANIDFRIVGRRAGLEVKNASEWTSEKWGEIGSDDVPLYYLTQGVHYMSVLDYDEWHYAVLMGGNSLLHYKVTRDEGSEKKLIELERRFWGCVESGEAPPPVQIEDLARLYGRTQGAVQATEEIAALIARAKEIKEIVKPLTGPKGELDQIKFKVGQYMRECGDLMDPYDPTITLATYRANDVTRVDTDAVRKGRLRKAIVDAMQAAASLAIEDKDPANAKEVEMLRTLGPDRFADLICGSMLTTTQERRFLTK